MTSLLPAVKAEGLSETLYNDDNTFITVSEIVHRISLYISSSQLYQQQNPDKETLHGTSRYLQLSSDRTALSFGGGLSKASYDISNIIPQDFPGRNTPAKALLIDQLNLLVLNTRSLFEPNTTNPDAEQPDIFNSVATNDRTSFQKTLSKFNITPPSDMDDGKQPDVAHTRCLLSALLNKVEFQQNEIELQRATVLALENDLAAARSTISAITDSINPNERRFIDTDLLDRELTKSQNANRAFQKALREIGEVVIAVAQGDLSKKVIVHNQEMDPEIVKFKETINTMMDQLQRFASEVTRVATEVAGGTLGGQAEGEGTVGVWRELTDNVNIMASNLTNQVREIADVTRAVAQGDLSKKINVHAQGEILELQDTINSMVLQLRTFAFEVTRVARETGVEGMLGGQAQIDGVEGIWRELTDNGMY